MKKLSLTTLLIIITLGFSSCSVEEDPILEEPTGRQFEKVTVKRDASGAYSLDMQLNDGVGADVVENEKANRKDFNLFNSDFDRKRSYNEDLSLNGQDSFSVGVNNTVNNKNTSTLTIFDNDISFNKASNDDHLKNYEVTNHGDGTFDLEFSVDDNIDVDFVLNEDTGVFEIHLEPGEGNESEFFRTLEKEDGEQLRIEFVNYYNRSATGRTAQTLEKKPVIVWDPGEEEDSVN